MCAHDNRVLRREGVRHARVLRYNPPIPQPSRPALLSPAEADTIDALVAKLESRTGVQAVVAVVRRSDSYVELPWKAFALGASAAALAIVLWSRRPEWVTSEAALFHAIAILGGGATCALLTIFVPAFARLFLRRARREVEVRQYAQSLFLSRELFRTGRRTAVLVLVSQFERRIEILADIGLRDRVAESEWQAVIETMTPHLKMARAFPAVREALGAVEQLLVSKGLAMAGAVNELPDHPIEERSV